MSYSTEPITLTLASVPVTIRLFLDKQQPYGAWCEFNYLNKNINQVIVPAYARHFTMRALINYYPNEFGTVDNDKAVYSELQFKNGCYRIIEDMFHHLNECAIEFKNLLLEFATAQKTAQRVTSTPAIDSNGYDKYIERLTYDLILDHQLQVPVENFTRYKFQKPSNNAICDVEENLD